MLLPLMHGTGRARHGQILHQAGQLVEDGDLRPLLDPERFTFDTIGDAHAHAASGQHLGKVVALLPDAEGV
jgi:NADPH2:quinone reductase